MANFHWALRTEHANGTLLETVSLLEASGYTSALCVFQPHSGDPFTQATYAAANTSSLKYMVAVRPYAMTPAYCKMIVNNFYRFFGDRLLLNMVAGTRDEENKLFTDVTTTLEGRKTLVPQFINKMKELTFDLNYSPTFVVTGSSEQAIATVKSCADMSLMTLTDFRLNKTVLSTLPVRKCVRIFIVVEDTDDDAQSAWEEMQHYSREGENTLYGSPSTIKARLKDIESEGVTDFLLSNTLERMYDTRVHQLIKDITSNA